jgi:hypothetical protein
MKIALNANYYFLRLPLQVRRYALLQVISHIFLLNNVRESRFFLQAIFLISTGDRRNRKAYKKCSKEVGMQETQEDIQLTKLETVLAMGII